MNYSYIFKDLELKEFSESEFKNKDVSETNIRSVIRTHCSNLQYLKINGSDELVRKTLNEYVIKEIKKYDKKKYSRIRYADNFNVKDVVYVLNNSLRDIRSFFLIKDAPNISEFMPDEFPEDKVTSTELMDIIYKHYSVFYENSISHSEVKKEDRNFETDYITAKKTRDYIGRNLREKYPVAQQGYLSLYNTSDVLEYLNEPRTAFKIYQYIFCMEGASNKAIRILSHEIEKEFSKELVQIVKSLVENNPDLEDGFKKGEIDGEPLYHPDDNEADDDEYNEICLQYHIKLSYVHVLLSILIELIRKDRTIQSKSKSKTCAYEKKLYPYCQLSLDINIEGFTVAMDAMNALYSLLYNGYLFEEEKFDGIIINIPTTDVTVYGNSLENLSKMVSLMLDDYIKLKNAWLDMSSIYADINNLCKYYKNGGIPEIQARTRLSYDNLVSSYIKNREIDLGDIEF